jgi:hypothetical protein
MKGGTYRYLYEAIQSGPALPFSGSNRSLSSARSSLYPELIRRKLETGLTYQRAS